MNQVQYWDFPSLATEPQIVDHMIVTQTDHDEPPLALHVKFTQFDWSA